MMARYSFGLTEEAAAVEKAVDQVLSQDVRTADIAASGESSIGTAAMADKVLDALEGKG